MSRRSAYDERRSTHRSSSRRRSGASSSGRQRGNSVAYSTASSATTAAALPSPPQKIYAKTQVPSSSVRHGSVASSTGSGTYGPTRRWSNSPQRQTLGEQGTVENTQYVRVPEGCALSIEKGDIRRVLSAVYRVEGGVEQGVEKDVTDIIARRVEQQQGGLNIEVNKDTMRIRNDPYPGLGKVLVVTYVPTRGGVAVELARGVPSAGGGARDPQTQFLRVVEQSRLVLPRGTMTELLSAHYRVEGGGRVGLEKDVTDIVKSHVRGGGLDLPVTHATMQIRVDPCPEKEKVLVLAYRGRPEPVEQILQVKEGAWLEVPEDTIGKVLEADLRLPYHEESNHGYSVEMRQQVAGMVKGGGITGRYVTKESLGIDYDPFEGMCKMLYIRYMPMRSRDAAHDGRGRSTDGVDAVLGHAQMVLASGQQGYRGIAGAPPRAQGARNLDAARRLLKEVRSHGGWGESHLMAADEMLCGVQEEHTESRARVILNNHRAGYLSGDHPSAPGGASGLRLLGGGGDGGAEPPVSAETFHDVGRGSAALCGEPDLHPSATYHVGSPLGKPSFGAASAAGGQARSTARYDARESLVSSRTGGEAGHVSGRVSPLRSHPSSGSSF